MNVADLISELEQCDPDSEVRLAMQPAWAFEYSIASVVNVSSDEDEDEDEEKENEEEDVVYLVEGSQLGYLPGRASKQIGWR